MEIMIKEMAKAAEHIRNLSLEEPADPYVKLLNIAVFEAKAILKKLANENASMDNWWNDQNISLMHKVLMRRLVQRPRWIEEWQGFLDRKNSINVPLLIIPGESIIGKNVNIVISTNHEGPGVNMSAEYTTWDVRNAVKSIWSVGLGGSAVIFDKDEGHGFENAGLLLVTGQVDMLVINHSRYIYVDNELNYIEKVFRNNPKVHKPIIDTGVMIGYDFQTTDWFPKKALSYL